MTDTQGKPTPWARLPKSKTEVWRCARHPSWGHCKAVGVCFCCRPAGYWKLRVTHIKWSYKDLLKPQLCVSNVLLLLFNHEACHYTQWLKIKLLCCLGKCFPSWRGWRNSHSKAGPVSPRIGWREKVLLTEKKEPWGLRRDHEPGSSWLRTLLIPSGGTIINYHEFHICFINCDLLYNWFLTFLRLSSTFSGFPTYLHVLKGFSWQVLSLI